MIDFLVEMLGVDVSNLGKLFQRVHENLSAIISSIGSDVATAGIM